jgi:hypothetical protein
VETEGSNLNEARLSPDFFSAGIQQFVYQEGKCLNCSADYVKKLRVCSLFFVLLDIYVEVTNVSVTHPQMLFTEYPLCGMIKICENRL